VIEVKNYIDGRWVRSTGKRFASFNPTTGEKLSEAAASDAAAVGEAVAAARRAFDEGDWRWTKGSTRAAALLKLADVLESRTKPISELIAREMGKPVRVNMAREVEGAVDKLRYFAGAARVLDGRVTGATSPDVWDMVLPEPTGVAALIIPWNDPVDLAVRKLGAALAAGCTTVVKSSEITPASTAALIEAVDDSGAFPAGVVNLVSGPPARRWSTTPGSTRSPLPGARPRACASWSARQSASPRSPWNAAVSSRRSSVLTRISSVAWMP
jgi:betaine-aldehyde dehydrogenase